MDPKDESGGTKQEVAEADATQEANVSNEKTLRKRRKLNPRNNYGGTTADGNSEEEESKEAQIDVSKNTNEIDVKNNDDSELKITVNDLNKHFTCTICTGYFRDAHTISECLHTFCSVCLYEALNSSIESKCPICSTDLGPTPHTKIVVDRQLQSFVDKLAVRKIASIM